MVKSLRNSQIYLAFPPLSRNFAAKLRVTIFNNEENSNIYDIGGNTLVGLCP